MLDLLRHKRSLADAGGDDHVCRVIGAYRDQTARDVAWHFADRKRAPFCVAADINRTRCAVRRSRRLMLVRQQEELLAYLCVLQADATRVAGTVADESAHRSILLQLLVGEVEER